MPWLLTIALLFVSATSAFAQWQTRVDVVVYSLEDADYRQKLLEQRKIAEQNRNYVGLAKLDFFLNRSDPSGYKDFVLRLKTRIDSWAEKELAKGTVSQISRRIFSIALAPYGMNPTPGDIQVSVVWRNPPEETWEQEIVIPISLNMTDGLDRCFERIRMALTAPVLMENVIPTSTRKSA